MGRASSMFVNHRASFIHSLFIAESSPESISCNPDSDCARSSLASATRLHANVMGPGPNVPFLCFRQRQRGLLRSFSIHSRNRSKGSRQRFPLAIRFRKVTPFLATVHVQHPNLAFPHGAPLTSRTVGHSPEALAYNSATSFARRDRGRSTGRF